MKLFAKEKNQTSAPDVASCTSERQCRNDMSDYLYRSDPYESRLYEKLRETVPIIDACINKIIRLTGNYKVIADDRRCQKELDSFVGSVKVGVSGQSLYAFTDCYLDSLLTYGKAIGEMLIDKSSLSLCGLYNADSTAVNILPGNSPVDRRYFIGQGSNEVEIKNTSNLVFTALNPTPKNPAGISILRGLPAISGILSRIYECIGQNFDRVGNVRYAVTYKPTSDSGDKAYAKERALSLAKEWSDGMTASLNGEIKDFIAVGDIGIKVIGAENQIIDTEVPVRQLLEEIVAKLSIPPFLLGLNWSTTERMSKQQADILTSELEFYRRLLSPVIIKICETFLRLSGCDSTVSLEWEIINLQDECEMAEARLNNAKAEQIEQSLDCKGKE